MRCVNSTIRSDHPGDIVAKERHLSFPLANGSSAEISAPAELAAVLDDLQHYTGMADAPGERKICQLYPFTGNAPERLYPESNFFQAETAENDGFAKIFIKKLPQDHRQRVTVAKRIILISLLDALLKKQAFFFHGALAADNNGRGILFCGPSGVGKSTAVAKAGKIWQILADDMALLSVHENRFYAQPMPTWSTYISDKERLCQCNMQQIVPLERIVLLSRDGELGISTLTPHEGALMIANSFIEMTTWHASLLQDKKLLTDLKIAAFDAVSQISRACRCDKLVSTLEMDICPLLQDKF